MDDWKRVCGKNGKGVRQLCYVRENRLISKMNPYHFSDRERWKEGQMQQGTNPLDQVYEDGVPVSYHPSLKSAKGRTPAQRSIKTHIKEYIEARGGVGKLSEEEKAVLVEMNLMRSMKKDTDYVAKRTIRSKVDSAVEYIVKETKAKGKPPFLVLIKRDGEIINARTFPRQEKLQSWIKNLNNTGWLKSTSGPFKN